MSDDGAAAAAEEAPTMTRVRLIVTHTWFKASGCGKNGIVSEAMIEGDSITLGWAENGKPRGTTTCPLALIFEAGQVEGEQSVDSAHVTTAGAVSLVLSPGVAGEPPANNALVYLGTLMATGLMATPR